MRLAFVGDIALGDHPKTVGFGFRSRYPNGIPAAFSSRLFPARPAPDLVFGNLEFPLGLDTTNATTLAERQCRGLNVYAGFLASAGVTVLNLANNHSAQHGQSAFHATAEALRASGIAVAGTPTDFAEDAGMLVGGHRIVVLGWSDRPRQYASETPPYNELGEDAVARIREARHRAELVIVSIHWGEEFVQVPAERERRLARSMIDAGASIVVGHHPHVLREVEQYAKGLIAYSLGNFVGDMTWNPATRLGGCLLVETDDLRIRSHRLALTKIEADYFPSHLSEPEAAKATKWIARQRQRQGGKIVRAGYESVVHAEHRRHVRATALMMARNLHRFPRDTLLPMLGGALRSRIPY